MNPLQKKKLIEDFTTLIQEVDYALLIDFRQILEHEIHLDQIVQEEEATK